MTRPFFLFAPGAGAPSSHPWIQRWKERLDSLADVETFDYAYMAERRRPDSLPVLIATHREALHRAQKDPAQPVILIGKSMGGRIGCHVSLEEQVTGLVCLGYPLCGGGDPRKLRDKVLRELRTPILFVQGTRDTLCPLDLLENIRREMTARNFLHVVEGGDHSLIVGKKILQALHDTQEEVDQRVLGAIAEFIARL
jgi:predicted alpha/beta-hydrolase family hydrolase